MEQTRHHHQSSSSRPKRTSRQTERSGVEDTVALADEHCNKRRRLANAGPACSLSTATAPTAAAGTSGYTHHTRRRRPWCVSHRRVGLLDVAPAPVAAAVTETVGVADTNMTGTSANERTSINTLQRA